MAAVPVHHGRIVPNLNMADRRMTFSGFCGTAIYDVRMLLCACAGCARKVQFCQKCGRAPLTPLWSCVQWCSPEWAQGLLCHCCIHSTFKSWRIFLVTSGNVFYLNKLSMVTPHFTTLFISRSPDMECSFLFTKSTSRNDNDARVFQEFPSVKHVRVLTSPLTKHKKTKPHKPDARTSNHPSTHASIYPPIHQSINQSIHPPILQSIN